MIVCPYCGTSYQTFQPNCKNCGAPLPAGPLTTDVTGQELPIPPPPPRPISSAYAWRLLSTDGAAISALVFGILGVVFTIVGMGLTLGVITAFVGIPFLLLGIVFLGVAALLLAWRYQQAQKTVLVLREGLSGRGQITDVRENPAVRVNGRYPWIVEYQYQVNGRTYSGKVSTLNRPAQQIQAGKTVSVLCLAGEPQKSSIYPHP